MKAAARTPELEHALRELLSRVPFLKLQGLHAETQASADASARSDWVAEVHVAGRKWTLLIEEKSKGQPRFAREAISQLKRYLDAFPKGYGILAAPFVSEESAQICRDAGVGYIDLAGNAFISFDHIFVERRSPENPFKEKREARSLFSPKATRVLRHLLQGPLRAWKVKELGDAAKVSLGTASSARQELLSREWAEETADGIRITHPRLVLDKWIAADDWRKRTQTREYSVAISDPLELAKQLVEAIGDEGPIFTQWFAAWLRHPYTQPPMVTAYVPAFPDEELLRASLLARRVSSGGAGLRLVVPKDEGARQLSQAAQGFQIASDIQLYLDLWSAGLRGREQAEELRQWPDFAGGWE